MNRIVQEGIGMTSQRTRDRLITRLEEKGIRNVSVLEAMRMTPRHLFVDEALASRAYEDTALPIGHKQTISQPYVVARMTEAIMQNGVPNKVLEIGTGSGYQAAILKEMGMRVFSIERNEDIYRNVRKFFDEKGLRVHCRCGDGTIGWSEHAPFDGIVVTAGSPSCPAAKRVWRPARWSTRLPID